MNVNPRPIPTVLSSALGEIHDRRNRLDAYINRANKEKAVADSMIAGLRKLIEEYDIATTVDAQAPSAVPKPKSARVLKPGELTRLILAVVARATKPLSREEIADLVDHNGRGLSRALSTAVKNRQLTCVDNVYGLA